MLKRKRQSKVPAVNVSRSRNLAWYIAVPLVLLLTALAPWQRTVGNFFAPYLALNDLVVGGVADQSIKLHSRSRLAKEVAELRRQNLLLAAECNANKGLAQENRQLRAMLALQPPPGYDYIACNVVLRDPWMWHNCFTINRGSRDGLQPGLAVIAPAPDRQNRVIMLGVIESVNKYTSRVITVVNPEFRISAVLPESDAVGFINPVQSDLASGGAAVIGFLPANRTFALNELIYTTGFESAVPAGLWLGSLESIEQAALPFGNRLYRHGIMRPAGDFGHLRSVVVARVAKAPAPEKKTP